MAVAFDALAYLRTPALARVLTHVGRLHSGLSSSIDDMLAQDIRAHVFMLQGLLRLYRARAKELGRDHAHDEVLASIKGLEDALGGVGYAKDMLRAALAASTTGSHIDSEALERQVTTAVAAFESLVQGQWRVVDGTARALQQVCVHFQSLVGTDGDDDLRYIRRELRNLLGRIDEKDFDMNDLEGGIHELRRQLRWIPITLMALDGLVVLDPTTDPIESLIPLKTSAIAKSRFGQLPKSKRETRFIAWPQSAFLELSRIIALLGDLKDRGQQHHALRGTTKDDVMNHITNEAAHVLRGMRAIKLLKRTRQSL
jgi:hypothetical protein